MPDAPAADEKRAAAFFDLDKTLMEGSSGLHFGRAVYRAGMVSRRQLAKWGLDNLSFRLRGVTDERAGALVEQVRELMTGIEEREIARLFPEIFAAVLPRVYPRMLDEVHNHQDAGRKTFIVSAAGDALVAALADVLGMEGGIGTKYEVGPDGRFTGQLDGPFVYGEGKVDAMRSYASEHNLDLETSYAYSDSVSDLPMLRCVGNPVVVNPDPRLARIADEEGWPVMILERLGRKLKVAAGAAAAAAAGSAGTAVARRRQGGTLARLRHRVRARRPRLRGRR